MLTSFIFSYFLLSSLYICRERSTNPPLFIQNKPNFKNDQINVNKVLERDYENIRLHRSPKRTQFKPNSNPIYEMPKMNVSSSIRKDYENICLYKRGKIKPNSNPKQTQFQTLRTLCEGFSYFSGYSLFALLQQLFRIKVYTAIYIYVPRYFRIVSISASGLADLSTNSLASLRIASSRVAMVSPHL